MSRKLGLPLVNMASICSLLLVAWLMVHSASSARIVGFSSMSSGSHYLLISTVLEELASRGHEVSRGLNRAARSVLGLHRRQINSQS